MISYRFHHATHHRIPPPHIDEQIVPPGLSAPILDEPRYLLGREARDRRRGRRRVARLGVAEPGRCR